MTNSIPVSLESIWKRNHCQLKWNREIFFLRDCSVPHRGGVYCLAFLNVEDCFSTTKCRDL